jgi:hypothetical protein
LSPCPFRFSLTEYNSIDIYDFLKLQSFIQNQIILTKVFELLPEVLKRLHSAVLLWLYNLSLVWLLILVLHKCSRLFCLPHDECTSFPAVTDYRHLFHPHIAPLEQHFG